jgi:hypothetical protein
MRSAVVDAYQAVARVKSQCSKHPQEIDMRSILAFVIVAALSAGALAQSDKEHAAHHPAGAASSTADSSKAPTTAQMDMQMKAMQAMHERMAAARTPEERQALMSEHLKAMQDGMAMMGRMHGGGGATSGAGMGGGTSMSPEMMGRRMDMMETMMRMMMDQAPSPAAK